MLVTERNEAEILERISRFPEVTVDTETDGLEIERDAQLVGLCIEARDGDVIDEAVYAPFRHRTGNLPNIKRWIEVIERKKQRYWNAGFDLKVLWKEGMSHDVDVRDSMLDHHLLNENEYSFGLKPNACRYLGPDANLADRRLEYELVSSLVPDKGSMWQLEPARVEPYGCDDVRLTREMADFHAPHLARQDLDEVSAGVGRYAMVCAEMEERGITLDLEAIPGIIGDAHQRLMDLTHQARQSAGRPINLDSPKVCAKWLGLASTDAATLARNDSPDVEILREFRKYAVAISKYYKPFLAMHVDGVLHCDMLLHGTYTGRMSVRRPPLQSLPRDTKAYRVKELLQAREGYVLLSADFSQAEIIVASHYGRERGMQAVIRSGKKIHSVVSEQLAIPYDPAKRLNFSVIYGIGAETLADQLDIPERQAQRYLDRYHARYPGFRRLQRGAEAAARKNRYIRLVSGRRRHFNKGDLTPFHKASSNLIQGSVAEEMRLAQTRLRDELRSEDVHQLLQVHDAGIMEVPEDKVEKIVPAVREIMEQPEKYTVPLKVDIGVGLNLACMEAI